MSIFYQIPNRCIGTPSSKKVIIKFPSNVWITAAFELTNVDYKHGRCEYPRGVCMYRHFGEMNVHVSQWIAEK